MAVPPMRPMPPSPPAGVQDPGPQGGAPAPTDVPPLAALAELAGAAQTPESLQQYIAEASGPQIIALVRDITQYVIPQVKAKMESAPPEASGAQPPAPNNPVAQPAQ